MTVHLRSDQCCHEPGCIRPARYGTMCARCWMGSTPARRSVELDPPRNLSAWDIVACAERMLG